MPIRPALAVLGLLALSLAGCSTSTCPSGQDKCTLGNQCVTECNDGCCVLNHLCHANADCSGSTPVCDTSSGACVACAADTDCSSGQKCLNSECVAQSVCQSSADCSGTTPVCDTSTDTCVACLTSDDCHGLLTVCENNACVQTPSCTSNNDCSSDAPYCNTLFDRCGVCFTNSECPSSPPDQGCYSGMCFAGVGCTNDSACPSNDACAPFTTSEDLGFQMLCEQGYPAGAKGGAACVNTVSTACYSGMCSMMSTDDGFCLDACQTDADCAPGMQCPPEGVVFADLAGPDNVLSTDDDVLDSVRICFPASCTSDAQCADAGYDGAPRLCGLSPGTLTNTSVTADALNWVTVCRTATGERTGNAPCGVDQDCATGQCFIAADGGLGECFDACATDSDCGDAGTCEDSPLVDESGNSIKTCVE